MDEFGGEEGGNESDRIARGWRLSAKTVVAAEERGAAEVAGAAYVALSEQRQELTITRFHSCRTRHGGFRSISRVARNRV